MLLEEVLRSLGGGLFGSLLLWSLCDEVGWLGWQRILFRMHEMYYGDKVSVDEACIPYDSLSPMSYLVSASM